ncbi:Rieske (2Fe-2S) protein [Methylorubrum aminovorans]
MPVRMRYPGSLPDLSRLSQAPLLHEWLLEPDDRSADGAVLTGVVTGHPCYPDGARVTTGTVQMIEDTPAGPYGGWAWSYAMGLIRLGRCIDLPYSRNIPL